MPLSTRQQVALAALRLAGAAAAGPPGAVPGGVPGAGETIAQQAGAAAHAGGGHGAPKKVATALGAEKYKAPIGSLIIPHEHFIKGQPSHWSTGISQAKWVQNQWKSKPDADDAAHKAVEAGTHRWVHAGGHEFAVHKSVEVHVPKATDLHDEAAVAKAPKLFIHHGEPSTRLAVNHLGVGEVHEHHPEDHQMVENTWKPLHQPETPQKSVSFNGKHAAWVPHDWQVYKAHAPEDQLQGKWAKDTNGDWHNVDKGTGVHGPNENQDKDVVDSWVKQGHLIPDDDHAADHGIPPVKEGVQPGKKDIGGVAATKAEMQHALSILQADKSTAVKQPLAKAGHPLAAMDYHGVSKQELAKHPELKVAPGTKKAHVGQVKLAVIHHLTRQIQSLSNSEAEAHVAEAAQDKAQAVAEHAHDLTPHTAELPKDEPGKAPVPVAVGGKQVGTAPTGTKLYIWHAQVQQAGPDAAKYALFPDGTWHYYDAHGKTANPDLNMGKDLAAGNLIPAEKVRAVETPAAEAVQDKAEAAQDAEQAAADITVPQAGGGTISAAKEDVQAAIDALTAAKSTAIKQVLKAKGSMLQDVDYWKVIHDYEAAHPNTAGKSHGTKQAHVPNAKAMFIAALKEKSAALAKADQATGHDKSAELYALAKGSIKPGGKPDMAGYAIAVAAHQAVANDHNYYVYLVNGSWAVSAIKPAGEVDYKVTPELELTGYAVDPKGTDSPVLLWNALHQWLEPKAGEEAPQPAKPEPVKAPEEPKPHLSEVLANAKASKEWKAQPGWQKLHNQLEAMKEPLASFSETADLKQNLAYLLWKSQVFEYPVYMVSLDGKWKYLTKPPQPGSYAATTASWWEVRPDHRIISHAADGGTSNIPLENVQAVLDMATPSSNTLLDSPETVTAGQYTYTVPAGSATFKSSAMAYTYVRHADGTWTTVDSFNGIEDVAPGNYKTLDEWAAGNGDVKLDPVNDAAKKFQADAASKPPPAPAEPQADVKVYFNGKYASSFPAGSKVYAWAKSASTVKYVKKPDGSWHYAYLDGKVSPAAASNNWDHDVAGSSEYVLEQYGANGLPLAPEPKEETAPAEADAAPAGIPAIYKAENKIVGEFPAGTEFYYKHVGSYQGTYGKTPDGKWLMAAAHGVKEVPPYYQLKDAKVGPPEQGGTLEKVPPPSEADIATAKSVMQLKELANHGTVDPAKGTNGVYKSWQLAAAAEMANSKKTGYGDITVIPVPGGGYKAGWVYSSADEHWIIKPSAMTVTHYKPGGEAEDVPVQQLLEAAKRYIVPNTVVIDGKQHAFGYWKKPKGSAYVEIKAHDWHANSYKYGTAAYANYVYHAPDGSVKDMTPAAATKWLAGAEHYAEEPKPEVKAPPAKVSHVTLAEAGKIYALYSEADKGPDKGDTLELKADGSAVYTPVKHAHALPASTTADLLQEGTVLDQYGNTVVKPGHPTDSYHIWGGPAKTAAQLQAALDQAQAEPGKQWVAIFTDLVFAEPGHTMGEFKHIDLGKAYMAAHGAVSGDEQKTQALALLKELLAVPKLPEGAKVGGAEPAKEVVFLKSLPPGIAKAADVFKFTAQGWAEPYSGQITSQPYQFTAPELKDLIGKISQQYGGGKVVGTHLSLTKQQLADWVTAWKQGDMQAVFAIDAAGGKVSPAHPGAPDNAGTHHITWSPADPSQVPASQEIEGNWTKLEYSQLPAAEADNYLLKMGFQHGEYLQPYARQLVVKAHRGHDQDVVDHWTRIANQLFAEGGTPATPPLTWTEGLKPANPYDSWLQDQSPAENWPIEASSAFVADHQGELAPYAQEVASSYGYTAEHVLSPNGGYSLHEAVIQKWLDDAHAKEIAKQMVPVWKKVPTGNLPSHGHEVWKAVREIPYTGEKTTWFVKPAPDGKNFRIEQEHAANLLGRLFGFKTAESQLIENEPEFGQLVQAQKAVPGEPLGQYTDMPAWDTFSPQEIADMAMEHVLDAVLYNDDTSANNMIRTPDGHLVGIDKGRSWGNMDWPALAGDKSMDTMTGLVYTRLYDAIRSGQVSKDVADQAYTAAITRARKIAAVPDSAVTKILEDGFAHRTKFPEGGKEKLVKQILSRKKHLPEEVHSMWAKIYEDAGFGTEKSDFGKGMPWGESPVSGARYGMVVFNDKGEVLLREAKGHFQGSAWTFAKGGQEVGEAPLQAATREVAEETKYKFTPVDYVPGSFKGSSSTTYYYLATAKDAQFVPEMDNGETEQTGWFSVADAHNMIDTSESEEVRARDHAVLDAAVKAWGSGKYDAPALADVNALASPLPNVPVAKLPSTIHGDKLFAGFSEPEFTDHVASAKSHGVPAFFGGPELRDMHVLVWQQNTSAGDKTTHGETFLRGRGYAKVMGWLEKKAGKATSHSVNDTQTLYPDGTGLPGRAPSSSAHRGGISKERDYYNTIISAARTVTRHKSDGKYNTTVLENMDATESDLQQLLTGAEAALAGGLTGDSETQVRNMQEMSKYYLGLIAEVRKAKEGSYGFTESQLPRWLPTASQPEEPAKDELAALGIKVTYGDSANHDKGSIDPTTGEFKPEGSTHSDPGNWYRVTLPGGEQIMVGNGDSAGVHEAHHGRLRFSTPDHSAASLENIRSALQLMGLEMREAETRDFEAYYWRHMLSTLDDRADGHTGIRKQVWDELKAQATAHGVNWTFGNGDNKHREIIAALEELGKADPEAETDIYRHAFAKLTSEAQVADWAERGGFLPQLKHFDVINPGQAGGKPDWYRFDLAAKAASLPAPIRQSTKSESAAVGVVHNGGSYSKDALMRVAGTKASGMGNPYSSGATPYVFTRLNVTSDRHTMWSPLVAARSRNYSYTDDNYGYTVSKDGYQGRRASAYWDSGTWSKYSSGNNETMISDALSLLDDLELVRAYNETQRQDLIKYLKDHGVTHIRHMPVEDRIVTSIGSAEVAKVKANWAQHPELLDPLAAPGTYSGLPGPAQKAETAVADTSQAAESGAAAAQAADPHHLKFITDSIANMTNSEFEVWQSPGNTDLYYVKFPSSGQWYSYEKDESGSLIGPEAETMDAFVQNLDEGTQDGTMTKVWPSGDAALKPLADQLAGVMKAAGKKTAYSANGTGYPVPEDWTAYKSSATGAAANGGAGKSVWAKDPQGNWWKVGGVTSGTEPVKVAPAGTPSAADYQEWVTDGTIVSATV